MLQDERQNIQYDRDFCYKIAKGETALHIAAKRGHKELAELLIAKGWDRVEKLQDGITRWFSFKFFEKRSQWN